MTKPSVHGVIPPLVKPFRADQRIDCGAWQTIIDVPIKRGVHGVFFTASQGES